MKDGFMDDGEIVADIIATLTEADRAVLLSTKTEDVIGFHHTYGRYLRNHYQLWNEKNPFVDNRDPMGDRFADQVSQSIIEKVWERVHAQAKIASVIGATQVDPNG